MGPTGLWGSTVYTSSNLNIGTDVPKMDPLWERGQDPWKGGGGEVSKQKPMSLERVKWSGSDLLDEIGAMVQDTSDMATQHLNRLDALFAKYLSDASPKPENEANSNLQSNYGSSAQSGRGLGQSSSEEINTNVKASGSKKANAKAAKKAHSKYH